MGKLTDFLTGGMASEIVKGAVGIFKGRFPDKMSDADAAQLEIDLATVVNARIAQAAEIAQQETQEFNKRIASMEGTASDLKAIPYLGALMLFVRGAQRPAWSIATMYFDAKWFSTAAVYTEQEQTALIMINILVLGFLFGERAIQNLQPLLEKLFAKHP